MPPSGVPIRLLVVDDEKPARQRLVDSVVDDPQVEVILEAENGLDAIQKIQKHQPNLVFLDIQMPQVDGLQVIDTIGPKFMPLTIFVTAYDRHALRAFDANALDYLLKPFTDERLESAMERAKGRLNECGVRDFGKRMLQMASDLKAEPVLDRLVIKTGGVTRFIPVADIDWIEAAGVYANLHVGSKEFVYRAALGELAEKLDSSKFVRVHRSAIVNTPKGAVRPHSLSHGEFEVLLRGGSRTRVSRSYRAHLEQRLGQSL